MRQPAVVNFGPEPFSVELRDVATPTAAGVDSVLLDVKAVGVCGSDLHMWTGEQSWTVNYPIVLGHEFAGIVSQVGENVQGWREGDRVVSETHARIDLQSPLSRVGLYNLDPSRGGFGAVVDGAMTQVVQVPTRILHRIPEDVPLDHAAITEPCCVAYNAAAVNSHIRPGDRVIVLGPGPIGILCAAIAKLCGAIVAIVGLPRDQQRLEIAKRYDCDPIVGDATEWAMSSDGLGVDGVIDATGVSAALKTALTIVKPAGWITKVGWGRQPLDFSLDQLVQKNIRLQGSFSHYWPIWERVLQLLSSSQLDVAPIIGGAWDIENWKDAFETMHSGEIAKAILTPRSG